MRLTINEREKGYIEELIWDDFKKVANLANEKDIIKADSIEITKDNKYEQIIIAKQRT
ncbi:hypothetical protein SAMN02745176_03249 [Lutispora thermophila DSM 19022]|uniref:Uncharacterized protein n=2 Tax=Lutispora TaxID=667112 RepID=A0A1M6IGS6_9FIRM|nr:hypothetical protein SAMN02745176_03249 [Lutispora thermophila DSM 19022]